MQKNKILNVQENEGGNFVFFYKQISIFVVHPVFVFHSVFFCPGRQSRLKHASFWTKHGSFWIACAFCLLLDCMRLPCKHASLDGLKKRCTVTASLRDAGHTGGSAAPLLRVPARVHAPYTCAGTRRGASRDATRRIRGRVPAHQGTRPGVPARLTRV